jgi:hypothetical protein
LLSTGFLTLARTHATLARISSTVAVYTKGTASAFQLLI